MALTAEQIQEQLEAYFDSDEGKAYIDNITANISDEYTESEGGGPGTGNFVGYGDISLEDWQKQNIVTDGNNNTSLSNDQLTQLKTFAAMQPKYDPIKVGVGMGVDTGTTSGADRLRSEELRKTPGPIYTSFGAYSKALQDHNKKIKTYVEDNKIPTSITTPDGTKLELNLGLTPVYYQEQRDGGRLQNVLHMNTDQGYYTQLGGVGQYGSYHRPKISQSKSFLEGLKDQAPFFAAFVGVAILGPMAAQYIGSTGMGQFLSTASSKIITAVKNAPATFAGIFGKEGAINATFQTLLTSAGVPAATAEAINLNLLGSVVATTKGISYAEQYLDEESRAALEAAAASATGASGLPGGGVYSGPGAGPNGEVDPNVIYNLTTGATTGAGTTEDEDPADTIDITEIVNAAADAVATPDENEDVIAANTAVDEATVTAEEAASTVTTVVQEENAKVDSAESYANYARSRYGVRSFAYRNAKKRADKAKLDAQNKINQARTAASVAQADFEDAKKAAIGAQRDAEEAYKIERAQAIRDAEAEGRQKIADARTEAKAAAEARAAAKEAGISEAQGGYSDVLDGAGEVSYDDPETTDYADTTAGQEEVQEAIDEATGEKKEELIEAAEEAAKKAAEEAAKKKAEEEAAKKAAEETAKKKAEEEAAKKAAEEAAKKAAEEAAKAKAEAEAAAKKAAEEAAKAKAEAEAAAKKAAEEKEIAAAAEAKKAAEEAAAKAKAAEEAEAKAKAEAEAKAVEEARLAEEAKVAEAKAKADKIKTDEAAAAAAEKEAPDYTKVEATPDGADALPADEQEIKNQVTTPPVDEKIKEDIAEPPKYPEKEEVIEETTETDAGGGGGGGAGEGAGAGQGGDTGADAEVGTTTSGETSDTDVGTGAASTRVEDEEGKWRRDPDNLYGWIHVPTGIKFKEGRLEDDETNRVVWENQTTGEVVEEFTEPLETTEDPQDKTETGLGLFIPTPASDTGTATTTTGTAAGTTTTTTGTAAGTDTTTTATTSTGTAGAATTPTETTTGGAGTGEDLGTSDTAADQDQTGAGADGAGTGTTGPADEVGAGDADATGTGTGAADVTGTGTGASGTPGAGAGEVGDPGDVGEGTGTGAGTGTGTGGGTGSGTGTGTGSGEGAGEGSGTGTGTGFGSQQLMQLLQPRRVQVESKPTEELKYVYDISGRYIPIEQYRSPFGLPSLNTPPQRTRPMGFKRGGLVSQHTDNISNYKEVGTVNDLLRILRDKR